MKTYLLATLLLISIDSIYCQRNSPTGFFIGDSIFLFANNKDDNIIEIYKNTNSDIFFLANLIRIKNNRFYVCIEPVNDTTKHIVYGWVTIGSIGIGMTNKTFNEITLYQNPTYTSDKNMVKINVESVIAVIKNFKGKWLQVEFSTTDNKILIGWLAPENQCTNLYTMCTGQ